MCDFVTILCSIRATFSYCVQFTNCLKHVLYHVSLESDIFFSEAIHITNSRVRDPTPHHHGSQFPGSRHLPSSTQDQQWSRLGCGVLYLHGLSPCFLYCVYVLQWLFLCSMANIDDLGFLADRFDKDQDDMDMEVEEPVQRRRIVDVQTSESEQEDLGEGDQGGFLYPWLLQQFSCRAWSPICQSW